MFIVVLPFSFTPACENYIRQAFERLFSAKLFLFIQKTFVSTNEWLAVLGMNDGGGHESGHPTIRSTNETFDLSTNECWRLYD